MVAQALHLIRQRPKPRVLSLGQHIGDQRAHSLTAVSGQLPPDQIGGLDAVGALVEWRNADVAIILRRAGFLDEAHAAVNLNADARHLTPNIGAVRLGKWREQIDPLLRTGEAE